MFRTTQSEEALCMTVSEEEVRRVAALIRLEVHEEEIPSFQRHFNDILAQFHSLERLDVTDVDPFAMDEVRKTLLRDDIPRTWDLRDEALDAAPVREGDFFRVPRILGEAE
jgi:aspartyl/glutamyl-tRNA(Asn/Gln) amidotransferase C subunit